MAAWNDCLTAIREEESLGPRTTWRIGGTVRYYAEPREPLELASVLREAERTRTRLYILGGGSNLLVSDEGLDGIVVRLNADGPFGEIRQLDPPTGMVTVGAALPLAHLLHEAAAHGLAGLAELVGIPGTVGGAVIMNAGNPALGIGAFVHAVDAMDSSGRPIHLERDQMHFAYRWSNLQDLVLTAVTLRLRHGDPVAIQAEMNSLLEVKRTHQPLQERSAGCVFRNPRIKPAGMLIEELGLKGFHIGDAEVSPVHANFIVNKDAATCDQVRRVIAHVRREAKRAHDIDLRLEIRLWL